MLLKYENAIKYRTTYRSITTRVSQLKIWHIWVIGMERNLHI